MSESDLIEEVNLGGQPDAPAEAAAAAADGPSESSSQMVLACEIPPNTQPGAVFHVKSPDGRYFEVAAPANSNPGDTINIVVPSLTSLAQAHPSSSAVEGDTVAASRGTFETSISNITTNPAVKSIFTGISSSFERVAKSIETKLKDVDEKYSLSSKVASAHETVTIKVKDFDDRNKISNSLISATDNIDSYRKSVDEKYKVSERASLTLQSVVEGTSTRVKDFDNNFKISEKMNSLSEQFVTMARQIDEKYAVSPTASRLVTASAEMMLSAYQRAADYEKENKISERASTVVKVTVQKIASVIKPLVSSSAVTAPASPAGVDVPAEVNVSEPTEAVEGGTAV